MMYRRELTKQPIVDQTSNYRRGSANIFQLQTMAKLMWPSTFLTTVPELPAADDHTQTDMYAFR